MSMFSSTSRIILSSSRTSALRAQAQATTGLPRRTLTNSRTLLSSQKQGTSHSSDTYAKEYDSSPSSDSKIHRVDSESENVQRPLEPPSGKWSEAGVRHTDYQSEMKSGDGRDATGKNEYESVSSSEPYKAKGAEGGREKGKSKGSYAAEEERGG
jgi:hypothetical protein